MFKKIVSIGVMLVMALATLFSFAGCGGNVIFTRLVEDDLEEISKLIQKNYIDESRIGFSHCTGFEVEIIKALDGTPEYFLVEFEPYGYKLGFKQNNRYYTFIPTSSETASPYKLNDFEKGNRYYCWSDSFATVIDGEIIFTSGVRGLYNAEKDKESSAGSREMCKKYSSQLK